MGVAPISITLQNLSSQVKTRSRRWNVLNKVEAMLKLFIKKTNFSVELIVAKSPLHNCAFPCYSEVGKNRSIREENHLTYCCKTCRLTFDLSEGRTTAQRTL